MSSSATKHSFFYFLCYVFLSRRFLFSPANFFACFCIFLFAIICILLIYMLSFPRYFLSVILNFMVHSYLPLSVRLYCSIYFSLVSVVTIYIPVLFLFDFPYCDCNHYSFYHISFLSSTMYTSSYIHIHQCYMIQYFFLYSTSPNV